MVFSFPGLFIICVFLICCNVNYSQSIEEAQNKALTENKKIIVSIYTHWCLWCKKMEDVVYSNPMVKNMIEDKFIPVRLNAEGNTNVKYNGIELTEEELALYFQAYSYPATVFLEPNGIPVYFYYDNYLMINLPGYFGVDEFLKILAFILEGKYKNTDLSTVIN